MQKIYMSEQEAQIRYGYSRQWFQRSRWLGSGPPYLKIPGSNRVLYPIHGTDEWFAQYGLKKSTSEYTKEGDK